MTVGNHPTQLHAPSAPPTTRRAFTLAGTTFAGAGLLAGSPLGSTAKALAQTAAASVSDSLTLAVVNFQPTWGNVEANVESMKDLVAEAVDQGAQLVLFPEMCVTGYVSSDDETDDDTRMCIEAAEGPDGAVATEFARLRLTTASGSSTATPSPSRATTRMPTTRPSSALGAAMPPTPRRSTSSPPRLTTQTCLGQGSAIFNLNPDLYVRLYGEVAEELGKQGDQSSPVTAPGPVCFRKTGVLQPCAPPPGWH